MKAKPILALTFIFTLSGCSTLIGTKTEYKPWNSTETYNGKGGALEVHEGVELWEHGSPEKQFKIIGIISQSNKKGSGLLSSTVDKHNRMEIIKLVKQHNGDGVIYVNKEVLASGQKINTIHIETTGQIYSETTYRENSTLSVFKYTD